MRTLLYSGAIVAAVVTIGVFLNNMTMWATPVFVADCHKRGGWAHESPAGLYQGCIFPPSVNR